MPKLESLAEQNAFDVPLYTHLDAARYLHVPIWAALSFSTRRHLHPMGIFERFWHEPRSRFRSADDFGPILWDDEPQRISFRSLASLFVISSVLRPFVADLPYSWPHPEADYPFFEMSHDIGRRTGDDRRLFTDPEWLLSLFDRIEARTREADRQPLVKLIALYQSRVEVREGVPVQFFPFSRDPAPDAPRAVAIDPELRFGRPTVKGAPTDVLAERWRAGDGVADLADDYGLTVPEAEEALRYEATSYHPLSFFSFRPIG